MGSVINDFVSPKLANSNSVTFALIFGVFVCGMSTFTALVLAPINATAEAKLRGDDVENDVAEANSMTKRLLNNSKDKSGGRGLNSRRNSLDRHPSSDRLSLMNLSVGISEQINLRDALKFKAMFWTLALSCLVVYGCVLPFNNVASGTYDGEERNDEP